MRLTTGQLLDEWIARNPEAAAKYKQAHIEARIQHLADEVGEELANDIKALAEDIN